MLKNTQKILRILATPIAIIAIFALIATSANAQNFTNNTQAQFDNTCGNIVMKGATGTFDGSDALGTTVAKRIGGTVTWARNGDQTIQNNLFFTNLAISGTSGTKAITNANVNGTFTRSDYLGTYNSTITHAGTFTYDGSATAQAILNTLTNGGQTDNQYHTLNVVNTAGGTIGNHNVTTGNITIGTGATVTVAGGASSNLTLNGTDAANPSSVPVGATLAIATVDGTGTGAGSFTMGANTRIEVLGSLTNVAATKTNIGLDASGTPSTVAYGGTAVVMPVIESHPYGRVEFMAGAATTLEATATPNANNIYIAGQVGDALRFPAGGTFTTNNNEIVFTSTTANANYTNNGEVVGNIRRNAGAITPGTAYLFHNAATSMTFGATPTTFAMQILPNTIPSKAKLTPDQPYVRRSIEMTYTGNAGTITSMTFGYLETEHFANGSTNPTNSAKLRGFEAYDITANIVQSLGNDGQKWAHDTSGSFQTMSQAGTISLNNVLANVGVASDFATASQLVFSEQSTWILSQKNGRWSNPATWVGGATPTAEDSVGVQHIVYTGLYNGSSLFGQPGYANNETELNDGVQGGTVASPTNSDSVQLAAHVHIITGKDGTSTAPAALFIGNSDADMHFNKPLYFGSIVNDATERTVAGVTSTSAYSITETPFTITNAQTTTGYHGLFIMGAACGTGTNGLARVSNFINNGPGKNQGTFEVGND